MEYPGTHQPHPYNEIHLPDSVTGFCYKCGKYAKEYGKYCNEIKRERKGRKMKFEKEIVNDNRIESEGK